MISVMMSSIFANKTVTGMDQSMQRFLESMRQLECFFIQKRLQVSAARPELTGKEVCVHSQCSDGRRG